MGFRSRRRESRTFWDHYARMETQMRNTEGDLPLFGQRAWAGIRLTGQWSFTDDGQRATTIGLRHGDPNDETAPELNVLSTCEDPARLVKDLQFGQALVDGTVSVPVERETVLAVRRRAEVPSADGEVKLVVDGQPRVFRRWGTGIRWYAACQLDDQHAIVIAARHVNPADVALVPVHDIEPYLAGRRKWIHAHTERG